MNGTAKGREKQVHAQEALLKSMAACFSQMQKDNKKFICKLVHKTKKGKQKSKKDT